MEPTEDMIEGDQGKHVNIRFYEEEFPKEDDLVMVQIKNVTELATIVKLLEYGDKEGIITSNEYTRHTNRNSMVKVRKIGKIEICKVVRVDEENGYIDLSKKRVRKEDEASISEKFAKNKTIQAIMRAVVEATNEEMASLYQNIVWPLQKKYPHALDAFYDALNDFDRAFEGLQISEKALAKLKDEIGRRLSPQEVKIAAYFDVNCFSKGGIDAIKESLRTAEALSTPDIKVSVNLVTPPTFVVSTIAKLNKKKALETIEACLKSVEEAIVKRGGQFKLHKAPHTVGKNQEKEYEDRMLGHDMDGDAEQFQFEEEEETGNAQE